MIALTISVAERYAYVKENVIYDIRFSKSDNNDICIRTIDTNSTPYIIVNGVKYYFINYISDGDMYFPNQEDGFKSFKKTIHGNLDKTVTYQDYYYALCEEQIANAIVSNYTYTYDDFVADICKLGVPEFMIKINGQTCYEVQKIEQIDFTEEYYNEVKKRKVREMALDAAQKIANMYGFDVKVGNCSDCGECDVECFDVE
jgi:hypothetical protein